MSAGIFNVDMRIKQEALQNLPSASFVAFSAYVWNIKLCLEIAKRIKGAFVHHE